MFHLIKDQTSDYEYLSVETDSACPPCVIVTMAKHFGSCLSLCLLCPDSSDPSSRSDRTFCRW